MPRFGTNDPAAVLTDTFAALVPALDGKWRVRDGSIEIDDDAWAGLDAGEQALATSWVQASGFPPGATDPADLIERIGTRVALLSLFGTINTRLVDITTNSATYTLPDTNQALGDVASYLYVISRFIEANYT